MTDRELLEAAAKAAGIEYTEHEDRLFVVRSIVHKREWNPLTDDGDALRLAMKMGMSMMLYTNPDETWTCVGIQPGCREPHGTDPYAATRRAIVRAAAALADKPSCQPADDNCPTHHEDKP